MKINKFLMLLISIVFIFITNASDVFATEWINVYNNKNESFKTYDYGNGNYRNEWVWCDRDGDYIAERYCYDDGGELYTGEITPDNETVNEDGKWLIDDMAQTTYTTGNIEETDCGIKYRIKYKSFAEDKWLWLDLNDDAVAERYYFDADGFLVKDRDKVGNYAINSDGAWTIDGNVQEISMGYPVKVPMSVNKNRQDSDSIAYFLTFGMLLTYLVLGIFHYIVA